MSCKNNQGILEILQGANYNIYHMSHKEILEILKGTNYKELFKALILLENESISDDVLEKIYCNYIDNDDFTSLINIDYFLNLA